MSLNPEPAPKRVGAFAFVLAIALAAFVLTLGLTAYLTRYNPRPESVAEVKGTPKDAPSDVDAGRPRVAQDGGVAQPVPSVDAGVAMDAQIDGGSASRRSIASGLLDEDALRETLGRPLAACIEQSLVEDPSARIRVKVTARTARGAWKLVAFSPASSPYFRRCAKRLALPTFLTVATERVFVVKRTGQVTVVGAASP